MSYQIEQTILLRDYLKELPISQAMIKRIKREGDFLVNDYIIVIFINDF